jgi:hypothetical protein
MATMSRRKELAFRTTEHAEKYAARFLAEAPGADPTNDRMAEAFAGCLIIPPTSAYPAIRRAITEMKRKESETNLREWIKRDDPIFSVERSRTLYSYYRIADNDGNGKPWLQNISVHIARVTSFTITEHAPSGHVWAIRTHYANEPVHALAKFLFGDYTALRHEDV